MIVIFKVVRGTWGCNFQQEVVKKWNIGEQRVTSFDLLAFANKVMLDSNKGENINLCVIIYGKTEMF